MKKRSVQVKQTIILPRIIHFSKVTANSGWFTTKQALQVHFVSVAVPDC